MYTSKYKIHYFLIFFAAKSISSSIAIPVDKIIGFPNFDIFSIKGMFVNRPEEILKRFIFAFINLFRLEISPGVEKKYNFF